MSSKTEIHDHSLSSFFTGTVIGAVVALTLGTEDGRKFAKNLVKTVKYLSEELNKQASNIPESDEMRHMAQQRINDFSSSVQQLNSTIQQTGHHIMDSLHRSAQNSDYFTRDGQSLK